MTINRLNQDVTYLPAFRNLVINGAMQVAQRGTSTTGITTTGYYTADRWGHTGPQGTWTDSIENDAPTGSGFRNSWKTLCTTADAAPASTARTAFRQFLEGQDLQRIRKGTSSAQQLTLSFWVKSNVTGTYILNLRDTDNSRQVSAAYTIASSGVWEKKTIVFPADTTGAFDNNNNTSLQVFWYLGAGSNRTSGTLQTAWATEVEANTAPGQTNLAAATNNYWQITGVQLEVGAVATPFEFKPFEEELKQCMRYYEKSWVYETAPGTNTNVGNFWHGGVSDGSGSGGYLINFTQPKRSTGYTVTGYRSNGTINQIDYVRSAGTGTPTAQFAFANNRSVLIYGATGANFTAVVVTGHWVCDNEL
jgi:hypothetical protein